MNRILMLLIVALIACRNQNKHMQSPDDLSKPMASEDFREYLTIAHDYLTNQQDICRNKYGLSTYQRWFYDQKTGLLEFFNGDTLKLRISYQEVGTISKVSNTWLWAWANPNLEEGIKTQSLRVKEFGRKENFDRLTKRKWVADEVDGWEMTAIMAYVINAKGAYRMPGEKVFSFVVFEKIELIN